MDIRPLILIAALLVLASCSGNGYSRSYIISDTVDGEAAAEPQEAR